MLWLRFFLFRCRALSSADTFPTASEIRESQYARFSDQKLARASSRSGGWTQKARFKVYGEMWGSLACGV